MDTGEYIAIDHPFTEGNKAYRKMVDKMRRMAKAMVNNTVAIHNTYHKKVHGGWQACNRAICRHTQYIVEYEGLEFD